MEKQPEMTENQTKIELYMASVPIKNCLWVLYWNPEPEQERVVEKNMEPPPPIIELGACAGGSVPSPQEVMMRFKDTRSEMMAKRKKKWCKRLMSVPLMSTFVLTVRLRAAELELNLAASATASRNEMRKRGRGGRNEFCTRMGQESEKHRKKISIFLT